MHLALFCVQLFSHTTVMPAELLIYTSVKGRTKWLLIPYDSTYSTYILTIHIETMFWMHF